MDKRRKNANAGENCTMNLCLASCSFLIVVAYPENQLDTMPEVVFQFGM